MSIAEQAEADLRELLNIPANYKVLFLQGGASSQFAMAPMNLLRGKTRADYLNTGQWSKKGHLRGQEVLPGQRRRQFRSGQLHHRADPRYLEVRPRSRLSALQYAERNHRRRRDAHHSRGQRAAGGGSDPPPCCCRARWT